MQFRLGPDSTFFFYSSVLAILRFYSLWDTSYAKIHIPIISSVSEHQPTGWSSMLFDLHVLLAAFPAGVWLCFTDLNNERVFVVLYAIFASYFAGVMVRLILTLTPIVCVFAAIAFSRMFEVFLDEEEEQESINQTRRSSDNRNSTKTDKHLYDKPSKPTHQVMVIIFPGYFTRIFRNVYKVYWIDPSVKSRWLLRDSSSYCRTLRNLLTWPIGHVYQSPLIPLWDHISCSLEIPNTIVSTTVVRFLQRPFSVSPYDTVTNVPCDKT